MDTEFLDLCGFEKAGIGSRGPHGGSAFSILEIGPKDMSTPRKRHEVLPH